MWFLFFLSFHGLADAGLTLELGEEYKIRQAFSRIWIENQALLKVQPKNGRYFLKALTTGESRIRLDQQLVNVKVLAIGARNTLQHWQQLSKTFVGISPAYCGDRVCLHGSLFRFSDFLRIINLINQTNSKLYLNLKTDPQLQKQIRRYYEKRLRENGITPKKILFTSPWKFYLAGRFRQNEPELLQQLGLRGERFSSQVELADNIKVSVKIIELNRSFERKLGVRWPDSYQGQVIDTSRFETPSAFDVAINAAEKSGEARILASPNLICRSGKQADFFAGGEIPVKILNLKNSNISWKRYGIGLKLKPFVDSIGQMSLQVETEVSSVDRSVTVDDLPAFHLNRVSSYFDLINKRTIALSGLIKSENSENSEGLPFLKSLPVLGALFRSANFQENKSELFIFVTPELLSQEDD